jgi:predicted metal-dependent phosphoesterase TrpH
MIDLHIHTKASDGSLTSEQLIEKARVIGLKAIAITDHDTVSGLENLPKKTSKFEVIPGIELSVFDQKSDYMDIHVLGLYINPKNKILLTRLDALAKERENQKKETVAKLNELGYVITFDEVKAKARGSIGRPHIAKVLLEKYPEKFSSISDIFSKLLGRGKPAYVERNVGFGLQEAIELIHSADGLAFLAHPFMYPYDSRKLIANFKKLGGDGVETFYDYVSNRPEVKITEKENIAMIAQAEHLAMELNLLECGGSDYHGHNKGQQLGIFCAPKEILDMIKEVRS